LLKHLTGIGAVLLAGAAPAQTRVPGDPHADDPVGIVADPCPPGRTVENSGGWAMFQLHALTRDYGQLCRYAAANRALSGPVRVVFMGDSITDNWAEMDPEFWTDGRVDRGIGGQTTPQMLVRFRQDVLDLRPAAVHIMAGTNDIAGNTGAATIDTVLGNIATMAELARAHGIKVVIASVPPAAAFPWSPGKNPRPQIAELTRRLKVYAAREGFTWADYGPALATADGAMKPGLASDGVHPTAAGYRAMRPVAITAATQAIGR